MIPRPDVHSLTWEAKAFALAAARSVPLEVDAYYTCRRHDLELYQILDVEADGTTVVVARWVDGASSEPIRIEAFGDDGYADRRVLVLQDELHELAREAGVETLWRRADADLPGMLPAESDDGSVVFVSGIVPGDPADPLPRAVALTRRRPEGGSVHGVYELGQGAEDFS